MSHVKVATHSSHPLRDFRNHWSITSAAQKNKALSKYCCFITSAVLMTCQFHSKCSLQSLFAGQHTKGLTCEHAGTVCWGKVRFQVLRSIIFCNEEEDFSVLTISFLIHTKLPNSVKTQGSIPTGDSVRAEHVEFGKEKILSGTIYLL